MPFLRSGHIGLLSDRGAFQLLLETAVCVVAKIAAEPDTAESRDFKLRSCGRGVPGQREGEHEEHSPNHEQSLLVSHDARHRGSNSALIREQSASNASCILNVKSPTC